MGLVGDDYIAPISLMIAAVEAATKIKKIMMSLITFGVIFFGGIFSIV